MNDQFEYLKISPHLGQDRNPFVNQHILSLTPDMAAAAIVLKSADQLGKIPSPPHVAGMHLQKILVHERAEDETSPKGRLGDIAAELEGIRADQPHDRSHIDMFLDMHEEVDRLREADLWHGMGHLILGALVETTVKPDFLWILKREPKGKPTPIDGDAKLTLAVVDQIGVDRRDVGTSPSVHNIADEHGFYAVLPALSGHISRTMTTEERMRKVNGLRIVAGPRDGMNQISRIGVEYTEDEGLRGHYDPHLVIREGFMKLAAMQLLITYELVRHDSSAAQKSISKKPYFTEAINNLLPT